MPAQLLTRLGFFLDQSVANDIMGLEFQPTADVKGPVPAPNPARPNEPQHNTRAHWPVGRPAFGAAMPRIASVVVHETSGWPTYASAENFRNLFKSLESVVWVGNDLPSAKPGHWSDRRGLGPQYYVEPNGTAYTLIGPQNLAGDARLTWHAESMNRFTLGIENGDIGDDGPRPGAGNGPRWFQLSSQTEDLTGRKLFLVLHPDNAPDAVLIWIARPATYTEPGDLANIAGWGNMIFTERNYRTLTLLCRLVAEQFGIPRTFLLLPYLRNDADRTNADLFRQLILAEERRDDIAVKLGTTTAAIQRNDAAYTNWYGAGPSLKWSRLFGDLPGNTNPPDAPCFKGFLSHDVIGNHHCPGPFFDWHRFAREVWDWWWWPFDLDNIGAASTAQRPYQHARRDTPLIEYYWDATGTAAQYESLRMPQSVSNTYLLPATTPVHAIANGVIVAARLTSDDAPSNLGFVLARHEVFHQGTNGRIDYDLAPTFVWTLTYCLSNTGFAIPAVPPASAGATPAANPDWLKRFIVRLRECELAVQFHNRNPNPANPALRSGWARVPTGAGPRVATGQEIEQDATAYRAIADDLSAGRVALFPLESAALPTPVRICLGDFLGFSNLVPVVGRTAVRFEIFSIDPLPVPNAYQHAAWDVDEPGPEWWSRVAAAGRHDLTGADLPNSNGDRTVWHYSVPDFLGWVNGVTWASEWQKYDVQAPGGGVAPAPARPMSRLVT